MVGTLIELFLRFFPNFIKTFIMTFHIISDDLRDFDRSNFETLNVKIAALNV